jgi:hypothetical protein
MTFMQFLTLTWQWVVAEAGQAIDIASDQARAYLGWARRVAIWASAISASVLFVCFAFGWVFNVGWPNSVAGLIIAPLLFVLLAWWTPLVSVIAAVHELAHLRLRTVSGAAVAWAKWWLGITAGVLLWQVIASLAFTFIPYWNAPSRIPILIVLTLALALMGIKWGGANGHRRIIKALVVLAFVAEVAVCFVPSLATLATASTGRLDTNIQDAAGKVSKDGFTALVPSFGASSADTPITPSTGKTLVIDLAPGQVYDVDNLVAGQRWRYVTFTGAFEHRIDRGDDAACWKLIDNNLPWSADYAGKLQLKGGNVAVKVTVNIL